jgi:hypothetical protein
MIRRHLLLGGLFGALLSGAAAAAVADDSVIFNSTPSPLPGNVASEGPEAYSFAEIGDGIVFPAGTGGTLTTVTVIMSSWACTSGNWYTPGTCVTNPKNAKFAQPITMNIYALDDANPAQPKAGPPLGTVTKTFQIPYRPSADPAHCPGGTHWYNAADQTCYNGIATPITFDFSNQHIAIPANPATPAQAAGIVVGISYNTTSAGPSPIGPKPCTSTVQGCPYDSLNVSTDGTVFFGQRGNPAQYYTPTGASVIDPNGIFFRYISTANACNKATTLGVFEDDTLPANGEPSTETCFTGYHPELIIRAQCGADGEPRCPAIIGGQPGRLTGDNDQSNQ